MVAAENAFAVEVRQDTAGWRVTILSPVGEVAAERACRDHQEAHTYASTVRQHIYWLSPRKFQEYYRI